MAYRPANARLDDLLNSDFDDMRQVASSLKQLEGSCDKEVFEIAHIFANVAAPIRGYIALGKPLEEILDACDYARTRLELFEIKLDKQPFQTVHSRTFVMAQEKYLDILKSVRGKILDNYSLLERPNIEKPTPPAPL